MSFLGSSDKARLLGAGQVYQNREKGTEGEFLSLQFGPAGPRLGKRGARGQVGCVCGLGRA